MQTTSIIPASDSDMASSGARTSPSFQGKSLSEIESLCTYLFNAGASAVASLVGLASQGSSLRAALSHDPSQPCRVLCIGLGGGTLPLFLVHHFPGMQVDVVEIDPVVINAAQQAMGYPRQRQGALLP